MNDDSLVGGMWRLLQRRWYLFIAALVVGALAAHVLSNDSSFDVEQNIQIGSVENAGALLDAGVVPEVDVQRLAQQAQLDFDQSELDDTVSATYSANSIARTVTVRISGQSEQEVNEALLELNARFVTIANGPLLAQINAGIDNATSTIESLEANADDLVEQIGAQELDQTALTVLVGELSNVRSEIADTRERQGALQGLGDYVGDSFVVFGSSSNTETARGKVLYAAGIIGGAAIATLAAAAWVLADRRVRRLLHLERAAPGTPILGFVARSSGATPTELDSSLRAAVRSFVADHQLGRLTVFGIRGSGQLDDVGSAIRDSVTVPVDVSTSTSAGVVDPDHDARVGYVAVARWGATTEDQVSTAIGDINRAGGAPVGLVLVDIPDRDRDWVAAGSQPAG